VLNLKGGTNADMAPQIDEFTEVCIPNLAHFGLKLEYEVVRKGFFPKGGGEVNFFVDPVKSLRPIHLMDPGKVRRY
jgi:RNA 3'-terminal phosphate cyclase (ATP)